MRFLCTAVLAVAVVMATMPVQAATVLSDQQIDQVLINGFAINEVNQVQDSALAIQNNIGAVLSHGMCDVAVKNTNVACVRNQGNAAMALQNNIGAVVGLEECSSTKGARVENSNCAIVENDVAGCPVVPGIDAINMYASDLFAINGAFLTASAAAFQNNIGVVLTESGQDCSTVKNSNRAFAANNIRGDCSAAVAQNNIGAAISLDSYINGLEMCNVNIGGAVNGLAIFDDGDMNNLPMDDFNPSVCGSLVDSWKETGECCLNELRTNPQSCPDIEGPDIMGRNLDIPDFGLIINPVDPVDSAVVEQNNIGAVIAQTCVVDSYMNNKNLALAVNVGNAAAALQNNIGVILAEDGIVSGAGICNLNGAIVANIAGCDETEERGIETENIRLEIEDSGLGFISPVVINGVELSNSAAAAQNNIAAIVADGDIVCSTFDQTNAALVVDIFGDSAFALQSNIGVMFTEECAIKNASMHNDNLAAVANIVGCPDEETQYGSNIDLGEGLFQINPIAIEQSAAAVQSNIGVMLTDYIIDCAWMTNTNKAFVSNIGNSAAAVQSNIGAILSGYRINGAHIDNTNCAEVCNIVNVPTDENNGIESAITTTNINILPINPPAFVQTGAYAQQSNIGVIYAPDMVSNSCVSNFNSATVSNSISF